MNASLQFLKSIDQHAVFIANPAGEEIQPHEGHYHYEEVPLIDGRNHQTTLSVDKEGFQLVNQASKVTNFNDDDEIKNIYESEIKALLKKVMGAKRVEIFDHTRRSTSQLNRQQKTMREPVFIAHNDYSDSSGIQRLKDYVAERSDGVTMPTNNRFAIVNIWRSMTGTVEDHTLALCDASSVATGDLVPVKRKSNQREGEIQFAMFNPSQRWFYFPKLQKNEALLFKTFDSETEGYSRFTPHTAFTSNLVMPKPFIRESIETRCFVFF